MPLPNRSRRLRLAARTLIEWKTPSTTEQYKSVLSDLLKSHPNAARWGLTLNSDVLQVDTEGSVLWYLSDTLDANDLGYIGNKRTQDEPDFLEQSVKAFLDDFVFSRKANVLWPGGPTQLKVAALILETTNSKDPTPNYQGWRTLLALLIPLESKMGVRLVENLLQKQRFVTAKLQSLAIFLRRSSTAVIILQAVICVLLFLYGTGLAEANILAPVSSVLAPVSFVLAFLALSENYRDFVYNIIKEITLYTIFRPEILQDFNKTKLKVAHVLETEFSHDPEFATSVVRIAKRDEWLDLTFQHTRSANTEVIFNMLQLIRDPDVSLVRREKTFRWLCKVTLL